MLPLLLSPQPDVLLDVQELVLVALRVKLSRSQQAEELVLVALLLRQQAQQRVVVVAVARGRRRRRIARRRRRRRNDARDVVDHRARDLAAVGVREGGRGAGLPGEAEPVAHELAHRQAGRRGRAGHEHLPRARALKRFMRDPSSTNILLT